MPDPETASRYARAAIARGALKGRGLELLWVSDPVAAFFSLESREGDPKAVMCEGDLICKSPAWFKVPEGDRQVLNRRVESVRLLCEADPTLLPRLRQLTYNIADGALTVTVPPVAPPTPAAP
jgi:hypothetical protein